VVFDRGAKGSWQGHVAMVVEVGLDDLLLVEGNAGPRVRRVLHPRPLTRLSFLASVRP
jgi:hypothetical protein